MMALSQLTSDVANQVWTPVVAASPVTSAKCKGPSRRKAVAPSVPWSEAEAHGSVRATLDRLASVFPEDYDFAADADLWSRLEGAIEWAMRRHDMLALQSALASFEEQSRAAFAHAKRVREADDLPPAEVQLELWFDELPE